jgi:LAO/AO transport system kinase
MEQLTRSPNAFVRPSPTGGTLGGVARRTREAMLLCEAAGFDVVLVETVGVGQSEVKVAAMVDLFLVLVAPGGGDELQGLKRGIMELADLVVVNKTDGDLAVIAAHTAADYAAALHLVRPRIAGWEPRVLTCSALLGNGIAEVWDAVDEFRARVAAELPALRARQSRDWMWSEVTDSLLDALAADVRTAALARRLESEVSEGTITPTAAARAVVDALLGTRHT